MKRIVAIIILLIAIAIQQMFLIDVAEPLHADINGDGKVNAVDITALERIIAGVDK